MTLLTVSVVFFQETNLMNLAESLLDIAKMDSNESETPVNKQTALYTLKLLTRSLASKHQTEFIRMVPVVTQLFTSEQANTQVRASALLFFAELVSCLTVKVISFLPIFMPPLLKVSGPQEELSRFVSTMKSYHLSYEAVSRTGNATKKIDTYKLCKIFSIWTIFKV